MTPTRRLDGTEIFPIGLGAMPMSLPGRPEEERSVRTIHAAVDAGVGLIDTADAYCAGEEEVGHNERLIARALAERPGARDAVLVATKGGHTRPGGAWEIDASPAHLRAACEASLRALGTDRIDLYQLHRPDPDVPFAESVGALKELRDEGKIRHVAVSNASAERLEIARGIVDIAAVQNQYSLTDRRSQDVLDICERDGIGFVPWAPLDAGALQPGGPVDRVAAARGVTPMQVALAWLLHASPATLPTPGTSSLGHLEENVAAAALELSGEELAALDALAA
jgi:aryl-alcohol dehydrogenase-like predicted oxidoreductase